ncbi:hypothetical protein MKY88_02480 [Lysinibacillus sp. FSL R7-0073]|uniref:hypothetical protein n=1 Tax=Lysinibacillus sp. FSL R7-0073 TaxID=2921669 RepID=UPI0030FCE819
MDEILLTNCLQLLKLDLSITHNLRDAYFINALETAKKEIEKMGVGMADATSVEDTKLIVDYAVWNYRKRQEDVGLPRNLKFRIHNRVIQKAGASDAKS